MDHPFLGMANEAPSFKTADPFGSDIIQRPLSIWPSGRNTLGTLRELQEPSHHLPIIRRLSVPLSAQRGSFHHLVATPAAQNSEGEHRDLQTMRLE